MYIYCQQIHTGSYSLGRGRAEGGLLLDGLRDGLERLGMGLTEEQLDVLVSTADADGSGKARDLFSCVRGTRPEPRALTPLPLQVDLHEFKSAFSTSASAVRARREQVVL